MPKRLDRVPGGLACALVERVEYRAAPLEVGTDRGLLIVHREVGHAPSPLEERLLREIETPIALDRIGHGLGGHAVFEHERGNGQSVHRETPLRRLVAS